MFKFSFNKTFSQENLLPRVIIQKNHIFNFFVFVYFCIILVFFISLFLLLLIYFFTDYYNSIFLKYGPIKFNSFFNFIINHKYVTFLFLYVLNFEFINLSIVNAYYTYLDSVFLFFSSLLFVFESNLFKFNSLFYESWIYNYFAFDFKSNFFLWFSIEYLYPYLYDNTFTYFDYRKKILWLLSDLQAYDSFKFNSYEYYYYRTLTWKWAKESTVRFLSLLFYNNWTYLSLFKSVYFLNYNSLFLKDFILFIENSYNYIILSDISIFNDKLYKTVLKLNYILTNINYYQIVYEFNNTNSFLFDFFNTWKFNSKTGDIYFNYFFLFQCYYFDYYLNYIHYYNYNLYFIIVFYLFILFLLYYFIKKLIFNNWLININSYFINSILNEKLNKSFINIAYDFCFIFSSFNSYQYLIFYNFLFFNSALFALFYNYLLIFEQKLLILYYIFYWMNFLDLYIIICNKYVFFSLFILCFFYFIIFVCIFLNSFILRFRK